MTAILAAANNNLITLAQISHLPLSARRLFAKMTQLGVRYNGHFYQAYGKAGTSDTYEITVS